MNGSNFEQLCTALLGAFPDAASLETWLRMRMNVQLNHVVDVRGTLPEMVAGLVTEFERSRRTREMVDALARERPEDEGVQRVRRQMDAGEFPIVTPRAQAEGLAAAAAHDGYAMYCDRLEQWKDVKAAEHLLATEVVFVPGTLDQGHRYFMERISRRFRIDPQAVVNVEWQPAGYPPHPQSFGACLQVLAMSLRISPFGAEDRLFQSIAETLAYDLAQRNIHFVHSIVSAPLAKPLFDYYTSWLPSLVAEARKRNTSIKALKCYQPVKWTKNVAPTGSLWTKLLLQTKRRKPGAEGAPLESIVGVTENVRDGLLRVRRVPTLQDITDEHLHDLCERGAFSESDRETLLHACAACETSRDKLETIDDILLHCTPVGKQRLDDD